MIVEAGKKLELAKVFPGGCVCGGEKHKEGTGEQKTSAKAILKGTQGFSFLEQ